MTGDINIYPSKHIVIDGKKSCQNYATLERAIETLDVYAPLPSDDIQPADRFERHRWLEDIQLPFPIMKWSYSMENSLGNLTFLWRIPEDPETRSQKISVPWENCRSGSQHSPPGLCIVSFLSATTKLIT